MARFIDIKWSDHTCMLILFTFLGIGFGYANEEEEKTLTVTFKLWKFHTFCTIGML